MNKRWCELNGDYSFGPWAEAPEWQRKSLLDGINFLKCNPYATHESSHENWLKAKQEDGWVYGPVKDVEKKTHPCMVSYNELPPPQRVKDEIFTAVVRCCIELTKHWGINTFV